MPRELDATPSRVKPEQFDFLSGVRAAARSSDDLIRPVFDRLEARLSRLDAFAQHATIHFAHASTRASREGRELEKWGTTDAKDALQLLAQTAELVGRWFVNSGVGDVLPHPQYDQFAYLERPMAAAEIVEGLQRQWDEFAAETAQWPTVSDHEL